MGINNKFLLVLRQETAGFSENGEATGYLKFEWLPSACRLAFGIKALAGPGKGEYLCALYFNGQVFPLGPIRVLPEAAFADFTLKLPMPGTEDIFAAGVFYKENGFLYPVITGHRGAGSAWHKDFIDKLCRAAGARLGQSYQRWSYTAGDGESAEEVTADTIQFEPEMIKKISQNQAETHEASDLSGAAPELDRAQPASPAQKNTPAQEPDISQQRNTFSEHTRQAQPQTQAQTDRAAETEASVSEYGFEALPEESADFYEQNKEHFERLLTDNAQLDELCDMIPGSKWVKVEYTEGEEKGHYIVGIIYDEQGAPMHICYGVPGQFALAPPDNLAKYCQWLPASIKDPQGEGYWVLYQSAKTGQTYGEE